MSERKRAPLSHFDSYDDQERRDLDYGDQSKACEQFATTSPVQWEDHSIGGDWTPDED